MVAHKVSVYCSENGFCGPTVYVHVSFLVIRIRVQGIVGRKELANFGSRRNKASDRTVGTASTGQIILVLGFSSGFELRAWSIVGVSRSREPETHSLHSA